jgi:membrane protease YdiL (CAAX protease family)
MKTPRLLENESLPDFPIAVGITFFIIIFSLLLSFITAKIYSVVPEPLLMTVWTLFSSFILTGLLLWYVFTRHKTYIFQLLKQPLYYFAKGFYYYLLFLPILLLVTVFSFFIFRKIGFNPEPQQVMLLYLQTDSFYLLFIMFFLSCVVAPFAEEIIFRGVIYAGFRKNFSVKASLILNSLIFAFLHNEIFVLAGLFTFGLFLSYLFEKHGNLWLSISVHFYNNFFSTIIVLILKYFLIYKSNLLL